MYTAIGASDRPVRRHMLCGEAFDVAADRGAAPSSGD